MRLKRTLATSALMAAVGFSTLAGVETAGEPATEDDYSVARFVVDVARLLNPGLPAELSVDEAVAGLSRMGVAVPEDTDLQAPVTEGDVVRFVGSLGLRMKSLDPREPFPRSQIEPLGILLRDVLATRNSLNAGEPESPPGNED